MAFELEMEESKGFWKTLLKSKAQENLISTVLSIECEKGTRKGDNYSGEIKRIKLNVLLRSGRKIKQSVMLKKMPTSEHRRQLNERLGLFKREIVMYRDILPHLENIMREFNDYTEFMWCSCLHYIPYDTLYFPDLTLDGYIMKNRREGLNFEHCAIVMQSLAKFHATSVILKEKDLIFIEIFKDHILQNEFCQQLNKTFLIDAFKRLADLVDTWEDKKWKLIAKNLRENISQNITELLSKLFKFDPNRFNVLCHGDCWINNMMFKNGLDGVTPISVKFIDFQLSFYNSPAFDLKYFFASSPNLEVRKKSINQLIEIYHNTLYNQLQSYSYKGKIITLNELYDEMKRIDLFGISTSISILPAVFIENTDNIPDMEQYLKKLVERNEIDKDSWEEYFKPPKIYEEIMEETLSAVVKNNSLFC